MACPLPYAHPADLLRADQKVMGGPVGTILTDDEF